jgi:hypothetical protein
MGKKDPRDLASLLNFKELEVKAFNLKPQKWHFSLLVKAINPSCLITTSHNLIRISIDGET